MDLDRLRNILLATTVELRKGPSIEENQLGPVTVTEIYAMPHVDEVHDLEKVDVVFEVIGVDRALAEQHRGELISLLATYPEPDRLAGGPSYIEVGAVLGSQSAAFRLFALGKILGLWKLITPASLGMTGEGERRMAGIGFILISGWRPTFEVDDVH